MGEKGVEVSARRPHGWRSAKDCRLKLTRYLIHCHSGLVLDRPKALSMSSLLTGRRRFPHNRCYTSFRKMWKNCEKYINRTWIMKLTTFQIKIIFLAKSDNKKIRVVGCGHSPSDICCTNDYMISLRYFNNVLSVDRERHTVKVEAGITFTELNAYLDTQKMALPV